MTELAWQRKIGEILLQKKIVTAKQLEEALKIQEMILKPIGKILVDMEVITEEQIAEALAEQKGFARISLKACKINKQAVKLFPLPMARLHKALLIDFEGEKVVLAMADPLDVYAIDDVRMITGREVKPVVCTESEILTVIDEYLSGVVHPTDEDMTPVLKERLEELKESVQGNIPALTNSIIELAAEKGASEVYFEPQEQESHLRFRLNGDLQVLMTLKKEDHAAVAAHLRKAFGMGKKGADFAKPQQEMKIGNNSLDMEVFLLPSIFGEDVCIRIFNAGRESKELEDLGLKEKALSDVRTAVASHSGLILGVQVLDDNQPSDGTTSLFYPILQALVSSQRRIVTVEDHIKVKIRGAVQIETCPPNEPSFVASLVLPAIVNSEPDVLMNYEIEDKESAGWLLNAALSGTLVLAAIRGEDSASGLSKLLEIGVHQLLVAESLRCIVAQKTVKKLCDSCRESYQPKPETLAVLSEKAGFKIELGKERSFFTTRGCEHCGNSGFLGTVGIFETMPVSDAIRKALAEGKNAEQIQKIAEKEGMVNLKLDSYYKALQGNISFEEFVRQIG